MKRDKNNLVNYEDLGSNIEEEAQDVIGSTNSFLSHKFSEILSSNSESINQHYDLIKQDFTKLLMKSNIISDKRILIV